MINLFFQKRRDSFKEKRRDSGSADKNNTKGWFFCFLIKQEKMGLGQKGVRVQKEASRWLKVRKKTLKGALNLLRGVKLKIN